MRRQLFTLGGVVLAGCALHSAPAAAQAVAGTEELTVYGGWLYGDQLTDQPLSGAMPRLRDHVTYGARYDHNFTSAWGLELSAGQTPTQAFHLATGGQTDLRLRTADLDVIWNFSPSSPVVGYTLMGVGYAQDRLDHPLVGVVDGETLALGEKSSVSANVGMGARYYLARHLIVRIEARYRYIDRLLDTDGRGLNTVEGTFGIGWRF